MTAQTCARKLATFTWPAAKAPTRPLTHRPNRPRQLSLQLVESHASFWGPLASLVGGFNARAAVLELMPMASAATAVVGIVLRCRRTLLHFSSCAQESERERGKESLRADPKSVFRRCHAGLPKLKA